MHNYDDFVALTESKSPKKTILQGQGENIFFRENHINKFCLAFHCRMTTNTMARPTTNDPTINRKRILFA